MWKRFRKMLATRGLFETDFGRLGFQGGTADLQRHLGKQMRAFLFGYETALLYDEFGCGLPTAGTSPGFPRRSPDMRRRDGVTCGAESVSDVPTPDFWLNLSIVCWPNAPGLIEPTTRWESLSPPTCAGPPITRHRTPRSAARRFGEYLVKRSRK